MGIVATAGSEAGSGLVEVGLQLALVGGIALALGGFRLLIAKRTRPRLLLAVGLALFAGGLVVQNLERLEVLTVEYYPGWKADRDRIFLVEDPDLEFSVDDLETELGPPAWWEGPAWWGQRIALVMGSGMAAAGFFLDGRWLMGQPRGRKKAKPKTKRASRSGSR